MLIAIDGHTRDVITDTGRLKLVQIVIGTVDDPMDLELFPFDCDGIMLEFRTGDTYRSADGSINARAAKGRLCVSDHGRIRVHATRDRCSMSLCRVPTHACTHARTHARKRVSGSLKTHTRARVRA